MPFRLFQHIVVWGRLVFVIVRFAIILPHRVILEFVPHQNASEIGMAVEVQFRRDRKFPAPEIPRSATSASAMAIACFRGAIGRAHPDDYRSMSSGDGIQMVNRFEITARITSSLVLIVFFNTIDNLLHLHRLFDCPIEPIDPSYIGTKIQSQLRIRPAKASAISTACSLSIN